MTTGTRKTTIRSQSTTKLSQVSSLGHLFPSRALVEVLSLFFRQPHDEFYQRDIAQRTGESLLQVQRALKRIEKAGLIRKTKQGNRAYYKAEPMSPGFAGLRQAFLRTVALADLLKKTLSSLGEKVQVAFLYGSLASGQERTDSDIDLLILGEVTSFDLAIALKGLSYDLGREINPVVFPPDEFRQKAKQGDHFVTEVIRGPKIWLIGNENELARVVE